MELTYWTDCRQMCTSQGRPHFLLLIVSALCISCNDVRSVIDKSGRMLCGETCGGGLLQLRGGGKNSADIKLQKSSKHGLTSTRGRQKRDKRCLGDMSWMPDSCDDSGGLEMQCPEVDRLGTVDVTEYRPRDGGRCKVRRHATFPHLPSRHAMNDPVVAPGKGDDHTNGCLSGESTDSDPLVQVGDVASQLFDDGESERSASPSTHLDAGDLRALGRGSRLTPWQPSHTTAAHPPPARRVVDVCMPDGSRYTVHVPAILRNSPSLPSAPVFTPSSRGEPHASNSVHLQPQVGSTCNVNSADDDDGSDGEDERVLNYQQRQLAPAGDFCALRQIDVPPSASAVASAAAFGMRGRTGRLKRKTMEMDALVLADSPSSSKRRCQDVNIVDVRSGGGGGAGGRGEGLSSLEEFEHESMQIAAVHLDASASAATEGMAGTSFQAGVHIHWHTPPDRAGARSRAGGPIEDAGAVTSSLEAELETAFGKITEVDEADAILESGFPVAGQRFWRPRVCMKRHNDRFGSGPSDWLS